MWKKTFIRLAFVMVVATMGLMVLAAANKKRSIQTAKECTTNLEKCPEVKESQGDFIIWESLSRTVLSAVQY